MGRAVPKRHELGTIRVAWYWKASGSEPCGYSSNWFQFRTASSVVVELPLVKPPDSGGEMKSKATSSAVAPAGTSIWKANILSLSRFQGIVLLPAWILRPTRLAMGPVGPCSPGIHSGYSSVKGPGVAGMDIWT